MADLLPILVAFAMLLTLAVLFVGVLAFAFSPGLNAKYGNVLMRWRVILQAVALALFAVMLALHLG